MDSGLLQMEGFMSSEGNVMLLIRDYSEFIALSFRILSIIALLVFSLGVVYRKMRATLWFWSGLALVAYAQYTGNQIFILTQTIMTVASFMLLNKMGGLASIITFLSLLLLAPPVLRGQVSSSTDLVGLAASLGLVFGIVFNNRPLVGNYLFILGGALMAVYSHSVGSGLFFWLNVIFLISVLIDMARDELNKKSV